MAGGGFHKKRDQNLFRWIASPFYSKIIDTPFKFAAGLLVSITDNCTVSGIAMWQVLVSSDRREHPHDVSKP